MPSDRHRLNELIDLHYCDTTSSLVWTSDGNKTVSSWNKSLAFSESRRLSEEERGGRRNVQTRSFSVLCSSRDITGFITVRKMVSPGHVGGHAVETCRFYWRNLKD